MDPDALQIHSSTFTIDRQSIAKIRDGYGGLLVWSMEMEHVASPGTYFQDFTISLLPPKTRLPIQAPLPGASHRGKIVEWIRRRRRRRRRPHPRYRPRARKNRNDNTNSPYWAS